VSDLRAFLESFVIVAAMKENVQSAGFARSNFAMTGNGTLRWHPGSSACRISASLRL
jgi:hypothetical protein